MSGECDKCGEHAVDCICDEDLTTISEIPIALVASIIRRNMEETQLAIAFQTLQEAQLLEEFIKFCSSKKYESAFDALKEFGKLHLDKFHSPPEAENYGYGKVVCLTRPIICKHCEKQPIECEC